MQTYRNGFWFLTFLRRFRDVGKRERVLFPDTPGHRDTHRGDTGGTHGDTPGTHWAHTGDTWGHMGDTGDTWGHMGTHGDTPGTHQGHMGTHRGHTGDTPGTHRGHMGTHLYVEKTSQRAFERRPLTSLFIRLQVQQETKERHPVPAGARHAGNYT